MLILLSRVLKHARTRVRHPISRTNEKSALPNAVPAVRLAPEGSKAIHLVQHALSWFGVGAGSRNTTVRQPHSVPRHSLLAPRDIVPTPAILHLQAGVWFAECQRSGRKV
jgi:hypothetical protein